jgi:NAD(P)-dependent dehydrogenase (short-subunit alcohol dehydrogenase family)
MPLRGLEGKVALVTGGGAGIGAATARRLAEEGMKVVVVDLDGDAAERVVAGLPGEALAVSADVSSDDDVTRFVTAAVDRFGRVDAALLNAGIGGDMGPLAASTTENFDRVFAVNVRGCYLSLRAVLRQMLAQGDGGALAISASALSVMGGQMYATYAATKHAILGLARSVALEVARDGIRVNTLCPGYVDTHLLRLAEDAIGSDRALARSAMESGIPLGRYGRPEEMAAMAAWLLSDEASYATGGHFPVDGGVTTGAFAPIQDNAEGVLA